jgi:hypothetical protein
MMVSISEIIADSAHWQMTICLSLLDRIGASTAAAHLARAIDALRNENAFDEISEEEFHREERVRQVLEGFQKQRSRME